MSESKQGRPTSSGWAHATPQAWCAASAPSNNQINSRSPPRKDAYGRACPGLGVLLAEQTSQHQTALCVLLEEPLG
jgi:hypothetical protein